MRTGNINAILFVFVAICLIIVPHLDISESIIYLLTLIMIWSIFAMGFDLVFGLTGMASLGHASFLGCGAFTMSILTLRLEIAFIPSLIAGGFFAAFVAILFGLIALRISGLFFALTTLAFASLLHILASVKLRGLTGGPDGLPGVPRPDFLGIDFYQSVNYYYFVVCIFLVFILTSAIIRSSPFGHVLRGIHLNEVRSEQVGFNIKKFKLIVFIISGFYSGVAGGLLASLMLFADANFLHWTVSGDIIIMTLLGGSGTLLGPIIGVAFFELLKEVLSSCTMHWHGILGVIFILYTIFIPDGMVGLFKTGWSHIVGSTK